MWGDLWGFLLDSHECLSSLLCAPPDVTDGGKGIRLFALACIACDWVTVFGEAIVPRFGSIVKIRQYPQVMACDFVSYLSSQSVG